uniref:GRAM domain-containing protein 1B-like isoform X4 n=1 Tax=Crassostrea virginica TaxID=6565 RepID=A0A8B8D9K4_CRAVI|nr:GRAM domain-containing protein 1B-like isoform X4 [Crassostrea virginica]
MNTSRNSCQNETDIRNNNEELEELIGSNPHALSSAVSSTVAAVTSIFRWSPQHNNRKRSAESDQDSQSSGSMNSDSPSKSGLAKFSSTPYLQSRNEETKEEMEESPGSRHSISNTNGQEIRQRHSFNSGHHTRRPSDSSVREIELKSSAESVSWGKSSRVSLDKTDSKSSRSPNLGGSGLSRGKSLSFRESSSQNKTPTKSADKSDSGSRSSVEFVRAHSRERSFEKSLENILDKCSERSLDMNVSLDSKNGMVSDSSRVEDTSVLSAKKSVDKSDKKKKNTPWYTMWNTSYKTKSEDFRKIFKDVNREDRLLVDYSCALQKEILVQGRMYITQNWVCFYANIFTWETLLAIPCKEITSITKEKTARVIPNAIQITTEREKYFFTSLANRDKTYMMLFRVWQNALIGQPMAAKEMWQWIHCNYGEELCLNSSDDDYVAPPSFIEEPIKDECITPSRLIQVENTDSDILPSPELMQGDLGLDISKDSELFAPTGIEEKQCENVATDQSDTTEDSEDEVTLCTEHAHYEKPMIDEVYNIPVEKMFEMLFTESDFYSELQTRRGSKDFTFTPWEDKGLGKQTRTVSYIIPLNYSIGPKSSQAVELQTCHKNPTPGTYFTVDTECSCLGIPYGTTFIVVNKYCVSKVSRSKSRIQISSEVKYKKSVWGLVKSMIEKNSIQGCIDYFNTLSVHLKQESDKFVSSNPQSQASGKRKIRKRRVRTQHSTVPEIHKLKPTRHLSLIDKQTRQAVKSPLTPSTPVRNVSIHKEDISKLNADTLVRVILVVLVLLVIFNAILFYKLWSLESYTNVIYFPREHTMADDLKSYPKSQDEWTQLLQQQRQLHESEIDRWKEIISTSIDLIDQVKNTMVSVKTSLEGRLKSSDSLNEGPS